MDLPFTAAFHRTLEAVGENALGQSVIASGYPHAVMVGGKRKRSRKKRSRKRSRRGGGQFGGVLAGKCEAELDSLNNCCLSNVQIANGVSAQTRKCKKKCPDEFKARMRCSNRAARGGKRSRKRSRRGGGSCGTTKVFRNRSYRGGEEKVQAPPKPMWNLKKADQLARKNWSDLAGLTKKKLIKCKYGGVEGGAEVMKMWNYHDPADRRIHMNNCKQGGGKRSRRRSRRGGGVGARLADSSAWKKAKGTREKPGWARSSRDAFNKVAHAKSRRENEKLRAKLKEEGIKVDEKYHLEEAKAAAEKAKIKASRKGIVKQGLQRYAPMLADTIDTTSGTAKAAAAVDKAETSVADANQRKDDTVAFIMEAEGDDDAGLRAKLERLTPSELSRRAEPLLQKAKEKSRADREARARKKKGPQSVRGIANQQAAIQQQLATLRADQ